MILRKKHHHCLLFSNMELTSTDVDVHLGDVEAGSIRNLGYGWQNVSFLSNWVYTLPFRGNAGEIPEQVTGQIFYWIPWSLPSQTGEPLSKMDLIAGSQ